MSSVHACQTVTAPMLQSASLIVWHHSDSISVDGQVSNSSNLIAWHDYEPTPVSNERGPTALLAERVKATGFLLRIVPWVFAIITASIGVTFLLVLFGKFQPAQIALLVQLVQSEIGMVIGLTSILFGVLMCWVGIEAPVLMTALARPKKDIQFRGALETVAPGIVLLLGGLVLTGVSLYLPINYKDYIDEGETKIDRIDPSGTTQLPPG